MTSKVLWGEGLFLRPQHFQQQDQYHEHRLNESIKAVHPYAWGVHQLQVDRDALANNTLRILELSLRFQDGELFDAPGLDEMPDPVDLSQLLQSQQTVTYNAALTNLERAKGTLLQQEDIAVKRTEDDKHLPLIELVKDEAARDAKAVYDSYK